MLLGAIEGAVLVGGVSALTGALVSVGIPKDSVVRYEEAVKADHFLVMAHGTPEQISQAQAVLKAASPIEMNVHEGTYAERAGNEAAMPSTPEHR